MISLRKPEDEARDHLPARWAAGFYASFLLVVVMLLGKVLLHLPLIPELMADRLFAHLPISWVELGVQALGIYAKKFGFLGCVLVFIVAGTAAGAYALRLFRILDEHPMHVGIFLYSTGFWFVSLSFVIPGFAASLFTGISDQGLLASLALLAMYLGYGILLGPLHRRLRKHLLPTEASPWFARRRILTSLVLALGGSFLYTFSGKFSSLIQRGVPGRVAAGSGIFPLLKGLSLEVTPVTDFYQVSKNIVDPNVDASQWRLEINGQVDQPVQLDFAALRAMPAVEQYATLECISNTVGGNLIGNAKWKGVRLRDLLQRTGLRTSAKKVVLHAADDYADSIPMERALQEGTLLVYEMNGEPLTHTHGFPARLIVPGIYGMKNVKWINRIEVVDYDFQGYWQRRGWDDRAEYKTMSRIDIPPDAMPFGETNIAGIAFAGDRGIQRVEVSTDGGQQWGPAEFKPALSPYTWVLWNRKWMPDRPGRYEIAVRATDGQGVTQTAEEADPIPDGASGYDKRKVDESS